MGNPATRLRYTSGMNTTYPPSHEPLRLLVFNLVTDADHQVLAFTTDWLNALAPYCSVLDVVTMQAGRLAVAPPVRVFSVGRERGLSEPQRAANFYAILRRLLREQTYDACFAHMMPLFAVMGAPLLRAKRIPITTWYTHRQRTLTLRLATRISRHLVTAAPDSFPLVTPKLRVLGHGIDAGFFTPPSDERSRQPRRIVQVARLSPIKHQHVLLEAAQPLDCEIVLVGDTAEGHSSDYQAQLRQQVATLNMSERVTFTGRQTPEQVRDWLRSATVAINLSPPGLFDKAALEAMACGTPTVVSSAAFHELTGPQSPLLVLPAPTDVAGLRERLTTLLALSPAQRQTIGARLRSGVVAGHSLSVLVEKLVAVLRE